MIPDDLWHVLGLDPQAVAERADFFEAFATLTSEPRSPRVGRLAELSRAADPRPGLEAFGEPPGGEDVPPFEDFEPEPPVSDGPDWARAGFEADALRQAASAALLVDSERGHALLAEAAARYRTAAPTYAMMLLATVAPSPAIAETAVGALSRAGNGGEMYPLDDPIGPIEPRQAVRLALAASSVAGFVDAKLADDFAGQPGARSAAPFGAGAAVISDWWQLATGLLRGATVEPLRPSRGGLVAELTSLAMAHGRQLELAKLDSFHWHKLRGPAELVDLDLACAACLVSRQLEAFGEEPLSATELELAIEPNLEARATYEPRASLAGVSLQVGLEIARRDEEPPPAPVGL